MIWEKDYGSTQKKVKKRLEKFAKKERECSTHPPTKQPLSCLLRASNQFIFSSSQATVASRETIKEFFSSETSLRHAGTDGKSFRQTARKT